MSEVFIPNEEYNGQQPQVEPFGNANPAGTPLNQEVATGRSPDVVEFNFIVVDDFTREVNVTPASSPTDY